MFERKMKTNWLEIVEVMHEVDSLKKDAPEQILFMLNEAVISLTRSCIFSHYIDLYTTGVIDEKELFENLYEELYRLQPGNFDPCGGGPQYNWLEN